jgi:hypothetical protein
LERYHGDIPNKELHMKGKQVIEFFGGVRAAARALGLGASTVCQWKDDIPTSRLTHVQLAMEAEAKRRTDEEAKETKKAARKARKAA